MRPFTQIPSLGKPRVHRDLALLLLMVAASCIPFLGQPFHMDDNFYLDMARNVRVNPLFPNDTPYVFDGRYLPDMGSHSHPPLQTYFLALLQKVFGEGPGRERIYHTAALIYPCIAAFAMYFLAARFVERPIWPAMLLAAAPVFQVMEHNLMTDLPALAFWLGATAAFVWGIELRRQSLVAVGSLFLFAAMFTSYQAAALVPLLAFYLIRKRGPRGAWLAIAAPVALLAAWLFINYVHYDRFILAGTLGYVRSRNAASLATLGTKFAAFLEYQGWLVLFPLFPLYLWGRGLRGRFAAVTLLAVLYVCQTAVPGYRWIDKFFFVAGLATGFFMLWRMGALLLGAFSRRAEQFGFERVDGQFLSLSYVGVFGYCLILFTEGSARYILPALPPLLIYYCRRLELVETTEYRRSGRVLLRAATVASGSLVFSLAAGLMLAQADQEFARIYPEAARDVTRVADGMRCFFGGEWGFRYYMRAAGATQLPVDERQVEGGDFIAEPRLALPYRMPAALSSMTLPHQTLFYRPDSMLRLMDREAPAGFYSTGWGLIPFSVSDRNLEAVEVRQVDFLADRLPWAKLENVGSTRPWTGLIDTGGGNHTALLVPSGIRVFYPWTVNTAANFEVVCGPAGPVAAGQAEGRVHFELQQQDAGGRVLSQASVDAAWPKPTVGGEWNELHLLMEPASQGSSTLMLYYWTSLSPPLPGAFAGATITPARR